MAVADIRIGAAPARARSAAGASAAAWLVTAFLAEGVVGKLVLGQMRPVPLSVHLLLTAAGSALLIGLTMGRRAVGGRARPANRNIRLLRICVATMIAWGLLSSVAQVRFTAGNMAFWFLWSVHLVALWWAAPRLLQDLGTQERLRLFGRVLGGVLALAVLLVPLGGFVRGRFGGPFGNPTLMGRLAALACLFWFAQFVARGGRDRRSGALWIGAALILALTRTRASFAAAAAGLVACGAVATWSAHARAGRRTTRTVHLVLFVGAFMGLVVLAAVDSGRLAAYLRIREGLGRVYLTARAMNWEAGMDRLDEVGFFGEGYLSKFDPHKMRTYLGITVPTYDWTTDRDPLNSVLGAFQQTGWVGGGLFVCFLALLLWGSLHAAPAVRPFLVSLCAAGLVWGLLDGNWLTSFGDPVDRLSFAMFALLLDTPARRPAKRPPQQMGRIA